MTVDDYLAKLPEDQRQALERIRSFIREQIPEATETISYGMPGFKYQGQYVVGYAAFKQHLSIFPTAAPIEALQAKLKDFKLARGTVQFTLDHPVPDDLIKELVAIRVAAIEARE